MSETQEIDVYVEADGTVRVEVRGVKGPSCLALTEEMERQLGGQIIERVHSDEFEQAEAPLSQDDPLREKT